MRTAAGFGASAVALIVTGVAGWAGTWALGAGAVSLLLTAVFAASAMDSRSVVTTSLGTWAVRDPGVLKRTA